MEELKRRLLLYVENLGQSVRQFEMDSGLGNGTVNSIKVKGPGADVLSKISITHPDLNLNWLLTGKGKMLKDTVVEKKSEDRTCLPILPFSAMAGELSDNIPTSFNDGLEKCYVPDFSARGADYAIRVDGDSMYPRYSNGEILAIRVIQNPTFFQWGKVYCLATNQGCVVKRLFPDPDDPDGIICHSENYQHYPDYKITKADIFNVAIVVGHIGIE